MNLSDYTEIVQFVDLPDVIAYNTYFGYNFIFLNNPTYYCTISFRHTGVDCYLHTKKPSFKLRNKQYWGTAIYRLNTVGRHNRSSTHFDDDYYINLSAVKSTISHFGDSSCYKQMSITHRRYKNLVNILKLQSESIVKDQYECLIDALNKIENMMYNTPATIS